VTLRKERRGGGRGREIGRTLGGCFSATHPLTAIEMKDNLGVPSIDADSEIGN